jgi:hypothetical protein
MVTRAGVVAMLTPEAVEERFATMMERLRAGSYARSELTRAQVKQLSDEIAIEAVQGTRYRADGSELEPFAAVYTFYRQAAGWRITSITVHDSAAELTLS